MSDRATQLCDRLTSLTIDGNLQWKPFYNGLGIDGVTEDAFRETSRPDGYLLADNEYGFGAVTLKINDEMEEIYGDPALFVGGERLDLDYQQIATLLDAIGAYLDEMRMGERPTPREEMQNELEERLKPVRQRLRRTEQLRQQEVQRNERLLSVLEQVSDEDSADEASADEARLTTESFVDTLRTYTKMVHGESIFDIARIDEEAAAEAVSQVKS